MGGGWGVPCQTPYDVRSRSSPARIVAATRRWLRHRGHAEFEEGLAQGSHLVDRGQRRVERAGLSCRTLSWLGQQTREPLVEQPGVVIAGERRNGVEEQFE